MLEKREAYLQRKAEKELQIARQNAIRNKRSALAALKRKKAYELQMERLAGARVTIETQVLAIENASVALDALTAMRQGAETMRAIHSDMNVDDVDDVMEEIREQMDLANGVADAISKPLDESLDEEELEAELEALKDEAEHEQQQDGVAQLLSTLPVAPHTDPTGASRAAPIPSEATEFQLLAEGMMV